MKTFSSVLATTIRDYLTLKRALGREYEREEWVLARLDRFLAARHADLIAETFAAWCLTLQNLASGARRGQMRHVRNLCLYRRRREPGCFVPDERLFPPLHQVIQPHILDRKSTRLNSSHVSISYAVFCLKKKIPSASRSNSQVPTQS